MPDVTILCCYFDFATNLALKTATEASAWLTQISSLNERFLTRRNRKKEISKHEISKISEMFHTDYSKHADEIVVRNNVPRKRYVQDM